MEIKREQKSKGHAIITRQGEYLFYEQVGNRDLEVYTTSKPEQAHIYDELLDAYKDASNIIHGSGTWRFNCLPEHEPYMIVDLEIDVKIKDIHEILIVKDGKMQ